MEKKITKKEMYELAKGPSVLYEGPVKYFMKNKAFREYIAKKKK